MGNLEKKLLEEIKRFNQIGYNSQNLEEQLLGTGNGSGFANKVGNSQRLDKFKNRQIEMSEQEDAEVDSAEDDVSSFDEMGFDDVDVEMETGDVGIPGEDDGTTPPAPETPGTIPPPPVPPTTPTPVTPEEDENTTEVEVTDLVDKQEKLEKNTSETNDKLESLMSMLDGMEEKLSGMDQLMSQITNLEQKIEDFRPKSEQEKLDNRKQDSGPFDQTLADFWDDSQEKFKSQGKEEYILKPEDIENFSETDIKQSFNV
jgi:hypothetical protein|tara:strand:+ start:14621 stop:15394 length:774 start_codon:yes stop_codon:yes gene_type:complete